MRKNVMIIGKDILGEKGFCMVPAKMRDVNGKDLFYEQLKVIKDNIPKDRRLACTSMISASDLKELKYDYIPTIAEADLRLFNPSDIYINITNCNDKFTPIADFIVWNVKDAINVMTFTKTAPVLYFETEDGKCALGVMLRKSIMDHGKYFFEKLLKHMGASKSNLAQVSIVSCTSIVYEDMYMRLTDYIDAILAKHPFVSSVMNLEISPENNPDICYSAEESGNHVVVIY